MEDCMKTIREKLYAVIRKNDWTLTRMSIECGISYRGLQQILYSQNKDVRLSTLIRISDGLGISLISLVDEKGAKEEENAEFISRLYLDTKNYLRKSGVEV